MMLPDFVWRCLIAMSRALTTSVVSWTESIDQPTMRRLHVSSTQQQESKASGAR